MPEPASGMRRLPPLGAILAVLTCCGEPVVESRTLAAPNPVAYEFRASTGEVQQAVRALYKKQFRDRSPYLFTVLSNSDEFLTGEMRALFGEAGNADDLYLTWFHSPMGLSEVYRVSGEPVPYLADFHLHLTPVGERTRVEVRTSDSAVIAGKTLLPQRHMTRANIYVPVEATTIEEYSLLLEIGEQLGQDGMPKLILPGE